MSQTQTIHTLLMSASRQLEQQLAALALATGQHAELSTRFDAEVLLAHVLGCERSYFYAHGEESLSPSQLQTFEHLLQRRGLGVPVAYLLGHREFYGLDLAVSPAALIPRPETELLVDTALALIPADSSWQIADLGTGSGAIALALASQRPRCQLIATDRSPAALELARRNAQQLGISNIEFRSGSWLEPIHEQLPLIVSNPPYVDAQDQRLQGDSLRHEPLAALTPGADGLAAIRTIIQGASKHLFNNGWLILEHGYDQAAAVRALFSQQGFHSIRSVFDLAGHERLSLAQRGEQAAG